MSYFKNIPILIISYNRYTYLKGLIDYLLDKGYKNIHVVDNKSTEQKLIDYYQDIESNGIEVIRMDKNYGHNVIAITDLYKRFNHDYFVTTDPDILPVEECPDNFLEYFYGTMNKYGVEKVGFGLKIDDLPDHYKNKNDVIEWEKMWWKNPITENLYGAPIDTTFALCKPGTNGMITNSAIRTVGKYMARHLTWYVNTSDLNDEDNKYYDNVKDNKETTQWSRQLK